jgi:SAM-dependent methyltransferase
MVDQRFAHQSSLIDGRYARITTKSRIAANDARCHWSGIPTTCGMDCMDDLRDSWEAQAAQWIKWARAPGHDSYWRYHRDQFIGLLPPPGKRTIDVGCGEGRLTRHLKELGHVIVGIDASPSLVAAAREADPSMDILLADATSIPLEDECADLAVAFMSLHDIDAMPGTVKEVARILVPGGRLCVAVVHPINSCGRFEAPTADARFVIQGDYLRPFRYSDVVERDGLSMTFHSQHRPLEAYFLALEEAGLFVEALREPSVPDQSIVSPAGRRWQRLPLFLHLRARRP